MWSRINKKRNENVLCRFENYIGGIRKQLCDFEMTCWALCGVETTQVKLKLLYCGVKVESRFACFYLTRQLEWILRKFQLAEIVLVVSKPHVFNLTGQLVGLDTTRMFYFSCDRSVAANIDYSFVSKRWYFSLQLRIGLTNLFIVVPRNDAIFPKLHTN